MSAHASKKDVPVEKFLRQFDQTAAYLLVRNRGRFARPQMQTFLSLARGWLGYPEGHDPRVLYRELGRVWTNMRRRKRTWNANIDLAPIDLEGN